MDKSPVWNGIYSPVCHRGVLSLHICPFVTGPTGWAKESTLPLIEWLLSAPSYLLVSVKPPVCELGRRSETWSLITYAETKLPFWATSARLLFKVSGPSNNLHRVPFSCMLSEEHFRQGITELHPQNVQPTRSRNKNRNSLSDDGESVRQASNKQGTRKPKCQHLKKNSNSCPPVMKEKEKRSEL